MSIDYEQFVLRASQAEKDHSVKPTFGIVIRAMNEWEPRDIVERGIIAIGPTLFEDKAQLLDRENDGTFDETYTGVPVSRDPNQKLQILLGHDMYNQISKLDMTEVKNWQALANITKLPYLLDIVTQDMDRALGLIFHGVITPQK
jgi:hypothetical protein